MNIIAITGPAGAGKSTLAKELKRQLEAKGQTVAVIPFAEPLKKLCAHYGWNGEKDEAGRRLLQKVGAAFREYDVDTWAKAWAKSVNAQHADVILCDDIRYKNEVDKIYEMGGEIIEVERSGYDYTHGHCSETGEAAKWTSGRIQLDAPAGSAEYKAVVADFVGNFDFAMNFAKAINNLPKTP